MSVKRASGRDGRDAGLSIQAAYPAITAAAAATTRGNVARRILDTDGAGATAAVCFL
jgi:hypothetical protein